MSFTNNAEAGPSTSTRTNSINKPLQQPKLELVDKKVEVFASTMLEDCLDYSLLISNNVSMARDQLGNERNWLTWFRLSCTLIILGFTVLIKFRLPEEHEAPRADITSEPVGFIFMAIGLICFFVGIGKYFKNQRLLVRQATYVEAGWGSYIAVGILFLFVCTIMVLASISASESFLLL